ncbi:MAG TPA: haloacid dehalogenase type II [Candidatus Dormibacteraeota bacterium]|nr:haloacid dehalogenase type II [Candidatus Dormibacteraeota bacterium]
MAPGARLDLKVLAFDVFGTVVDWRGGVAAEMSSIAKERQITVDAPAFADGWRSKYLPYLSRIRSGEMPWQVLDGVHRASLRELIGELSIQSLTEADLDRLVFAWHHLPPWPDAVGGMSRLRSRYVLTTLSNGGMAHLVDLNRAAQLPFDCVLSVELVRTYKPDPRVYRLVPDLLVVRPEESMMVASHTYDLAAAAGQGMRTAFVRRPQEWGAGKPEKLDISVDIVADDFLDLASQLGA